MVFIITDVTQIIKLDLRVVSWNICGFASLNQTSCIHIFKHHQKNITNNMMPGIDFSTHEALIPCYM